MSIDNIYSIVITILGSSVITLILSTIVFLPIQERHKYIFDEKKRVFESIVVFAQIVLFPEEAKYSLGVARYNIQELSNEENQKNALSDLKMAIPKVQLISKNDKLIEGIENFVQENSIGRFNELVKLLRKDLYKF